MSLVERHWDYSLHAKYYEFRPNYHGRAIDLLVQHVGGGRPGFEVADVGAGTGNLTIMLLERGLRVRAVEPNDDMRAIGIERTAASRAVSWVRATGTETTLPAGSVDWVAFGSSFNVVDRSSALAESHRILKPGGYVTCMWNHRDLADPVQNEAENIIVQLVPGYDRGVRRQDQRELLESHSDRWKEILYVEADFDVPRTLEQYVNAWRSVKNKYWDLSTSDGQALFAEIVRRMEAKLPKTFTSRYTTRAWTVQKV